MTRIRYGQDQKRLQIVSQRLYPELRPLLFTVTGEDNHPRSHFLICHPRRLKYLLYDPVHTILSEVPSRPSTPTLSLLSLTQSPPNPRSVPYHTRFHSSFFMYLKNLTLFPSNFSSLFSHYDLSRPLYPAFTS